MIYLELFLVFLVGLFTIGGGYAMTDASRTNCRRGWLEAEDLLNVFAISNQPRSLPSIQRPLWDMIWAAFSVPQSRQSAWSCLVHHYFDIARFIYNFLEYKSIRTGFETVKVIVVGLIFAVVLELILKNVFGDGFDLKSFDFVAFGIMVSVFFLKLVFKKLSAIKIIIISGILGLIFYGIFPL